MIFFPQRLPQHYSFAFGQEFQEVVVPAKDGVNLHGLLFTVAAPKGLVFYLHGNAGSVDSWGEIAATYTDLGYDLYILDYRGYGKSEGNISREKQLYEDVQAAYKHMLQSYAEDQMIIAGYSIGTGPAAMLAAANSPGQLILQAPYYSLADLMRKLYPFVPGFLLKYKFETFRFVEKTRAPIAIFHGRQDEVIYYGSSEKLQEHLKPKDKIILLEGQGHNGMNDNPRYKEELAQVLASP